MTLENELRAVALSLAHERLVAVVHVSLRGPSGVLLPQVVERLRELHHRSSRVTAMSEEHTT